MSNIDLDIQNYKQEDIEKFFKLNIPYTVSDVENKEYEIRTTLLSSDLVTKELKRDVIVFCTAAKQWLLFSKFGESSIDPISANGIKNPNPNLYDDFQQPPSSIPKNFRLDYEQIPHSLTNTIAKKEKEVIYQEGKPFIYTDSNEFFKGDLNPLNTRVVNKCLSIDSKFRNNYGETQASDFMIQLPSKINKVVSMQLSTIELPLTFYNISSSHGNNFVNISLKTTNGSEHKKTIVVPNASYSAKHLVDTINEILVGADLTQGLGESDELFTHIRFELDLDDNGNGSGKCFIKLADESSDIVDIGLDFTKNVNGVSDNIDIKKKLGWNLGFTYKKYHGTTSHVSNTVVDVKTIKYLYLSIDDYQKSVNNLFLNAFDNFTVNENTLARISSNTEDFTILMDNSLGLLTEPRKYFGPVDLQRLHVQLFDDHGRIIDFNESNFSFVLNLKILYDV